MSIACDRCEISLDNSCIELTSVGFSMKTNQIRGEEIRGGPSVRIVRRDARTFFGIRAATVLRVETEIEKNSKERKKRMQVL